MSSPDLLPRYDPRQSYQWNYDHAPEPVSCEQPSIPGLWSFCGLPVSSPLGIPAGPLLNGKWVLYYASLGFDVLTYKTVRSTSRECYPRPNLQPVITSELRGGEDHVAISKTMHGSWAVSFGMPSASPEVWRKDLAQTRKRLAADKVLSVSVVGTLQTGWSLDDLADDYALCARWAIESGADCIETNFSCPNICTREGQLYQEPEAAALVAHRVKEEIGPVPYLIKIGHVDNQEQAQKLLQSIQPFVSGIAMTNSVAAKVIDQQGNLLFAGEQRGICGHATREASLRQLQLFTHLTQELSDETPHPHLIACGGISSVNDVKMFLASGAQATHLATAAMCDPYIAYKIRKAFSETE